MSDGIKNEATDISERVTAEMQRELRTRAKKLEAMLKVLMPEIDIEEELKKDWQID